MNGAAKSARLFLPEKEQVTGPVSTQINQVANQRLMEAMHGGNGQ
jgi:hypothetical protein